MSLNIKNERTVALVRELAAATGESQTSAVEEAVRERLERVTAATLADASAERLASARAIIKDIHDSMTDGDRAAIRAAQDDLYDENGLFR